MSIKDYIIRRRNAKTFIKIFLVFISINLGTLSLFSQSSVTFGNRFSFGDIVVVSPGSGSVTLTVGFPRTSSGNVILIPSKPGITSLANFSYNYRGGSTTLAWSDVSIDVPTHNGMSVSNIVVTSNPSLPIASLKNNTTVNFTVTSAKLNTTYVLSPGIYTWNYTVTIKGTPFN
jgi:hypothetical protein